MNGRSIQDIVPPARSKPLRPSVTPPPPPLQTPPQEPQNYMDDPRPSNSMLFVWIAVGAVAVVAAAILLMSTVFHTARAEVTIQEWKSDISGTYNAGGDTPLTYQPVSVSDSSTKTVPATGTVDAQDHASGTIVVSNLYSAKSQRLITNTRFATADGSVYRTHAPITVPGYTTKNGQKVAGTVEAVVYADAAGDKYNIDSGDFKLPGLKGSTQYDLITGKAKGSFSGGFIGKRATVEKSVRDQAIADIKAELERKLRDKITSTATAGSLVFPDSIDIHYVEQPDVGDNGQATLSVTGKAIAPAFSADALARELASHAAVSTDSPLTLANPTEVTYTAVETSQAENGGPISFTLSGNAHLVASFSPTQLAEDLAGKTKAEADAVRASYPALVGPLTMTVYPFWLSSIPSNPERITVTVKGALDQQP